MRILALDRGAKRVGAALSDETATISQPLEFIPAEPLAACLERIKTIAQDRQVGKIVVGLPLNMDGSEGPAALSARKFAASIADVLGVAVEMFDERLTSFEARERLADMPARKGARKAGLDALAAVVILEGWMQAHPEKIPRGSG